MDSLHQLMVAAVVASQSVDQIIDDLEKEIQQYKQKKIWGADPNKINFHCFLLTAKLGLQEQCGNDPMKMLKVMQRAEASRKIFETKDQ